MVDALVSIVLEKLTQILGQKVELFAGATEELKRIQATFQSIQVVLADAESRQVEEKSTQLWLSRLKNVSYDIEDLLNDFLLTYDSHDEDDDEEDEEDDENKSKKSSCTCYSSLGALSYRGIARYKLACDVKEVRRILDDISKDKDQFNIGMQISSSFRGDARPVSRSRTMASSYMNEEMIGRDYDRKKVINWLVNGSNRGTGDEDVQAQQQQQVRVIAIVGIGGSGKTTLARKIFNDSKVKDHFEGFLYWVCVSQDFNMKRLLKAIIEEVTGIGTSLTELNSLQKALVKELTGKCFLLVLDDVWNSDTRKWNTLQPCLATGASGSRILITTRLQVVAEKTMKAAHIHELKGLSYDHSWTLFRSIAFDGQTEEEYSDQLESVGRRIVHNCKGVPLSITVMGSMLNSSSALEDWQNILKSELWSLPEAENTILPALWLSYYNLPPHLKQCFVFCSIFAEDGEMPKDELVRMWIAQGFVQLQGSRELEVVGAEYANDLVARSMLQEQVKDGKITFTMHDLLLSLAKFIAKGETYYSIAIEGGMSNEIECPTNNVRHAILKFTKQNAISTTFSAKKLRTLVLGKVDESNNAIGDLFHQARFLRTLIFYPYRVFPKAICELKHLRYLSLSKSTIAKLPIAIGKMKQLKYLDLSGSNIMKLPNSIGKMKQLRSLNLSRMMITELPYSIGKLKQLSYLDLSYSSIEVLPESVSYLCNLHTLNLHHCNELVRLPRHMGEMASLKYLGIKGTYNLECLPQGLGRVSCLQGLWNFIVGGEGGCGIHELQGLNALEESLEIKHLERVSSNEEAEKAELWNKKKLRRLVLHMSHNDNDIKRTIDVFEVLRPHVNLEKLELKCHTVISKLPSWIADSSFSKLTKLKIHGFSNYLEPKILPGIGKLPALKCLEINGVGIRKLGHEFYYGNSSSSDNSCRLISCSTAFPKLEKLYLRNLNELEEWEFPRATTIEGNDVIVKLINIMPCLCKLELFNCSKLEVLPHHFPTTLKSLEICNSSRIKARECSSLFSPLEEFSFVECSKILSDMMPNFPKLKKFKIQGWVKERLPEGGWEQLESLEALEIHCCLQLDLVPEGLRQLKKLKSLDLRLLPELTSLPDSLRELESLEYLCIRKLEKLESLPQSIGQLKQIKMLLLEDLPELRILPLIGQLESLERLTISALTKLESLPHLSLGQLKALARLEINDCKALASLPDGLQHLSRLKWFLIVGCPLLSERCMKEGVDWLKISHIPYFYIN